MKLQIVTWAVIDEKAEIVGAYTNRLSAVKRVEYLNSYKRMDDTDKGIGKYREIRCIGTVEIEDE